eukprot:scaffold2357_cov399-Prasinococcus_capsulatus_cf.AAC.26
MSQSLGDCERDVHRGGHSLYSSFGRAIWQGYCNRHTLRPCSLNGSVHPLLVLGEEVDALLIVRSALLNRIAGKVLQGRRRAHDVHHPDRAALSDGSREINSAVVAGTAQSAQKRPPRVAGDSIAILSVLRPMWRASRGYYTVGRQGLRCRGRSVHCWPCARPGAEGAFEHSFLWAMLQRGRFSSSCGAAAADRYPSVTLPRGVSGRSRDHAHSSTSTDTPNKDSKHVILRRTLTPVSSPRFAPLQRRGIGRPRQGNLISTKTRSDPRRGLLRAMPDLEAFVRRLAWPLALDSYTPGIFQTRLRSSTGPTYE